MGFENKWNQNDVAIVVNIITHIPKINTTVAVDFG